ncbi:MAG: DUF2330 domain-containing protein [Flavobacteriales bacterium]
MKKLICTAIILAAFTQFKAHAFCGFYVAKADAKLFNKSSQVILVRNGNETTLTMANDFSGPVKDFAMVIPVPVVLKESDIKIAERVLFDQLDAYSGPRLVEYYDAAPCYKPVVYNYSSDSGVPTTSTKSAEAKDDIAYDKKTTVTIEAKYTVGEYDILILSAKESDGLKTWLTQNGYKIPESASDVLAPYIKNNLKFFVVKVNVAKQESTGYKELRPLQIKYESPKFMLPIRLGMANSTGSQDLIVYAFSKTGRVECTNYRTVKIPTDRNVPLAVKQKFGEFYKSLYKKAYKNEGRNCVFLEYAWNVTPSFNGVKCDPCVGPPPIVADLTNAGVNWISANAWGGNVFFTRMHVRYSRDKFPQDLLFQETPNMENFQGRYILTNPATGDLSCTEGQTYLVNLYYKRKREVEELAALTGWSTATYEKYITEFNGMIHDKSFEKNHVNPFLPGGNYPGDDNFTPQNDTSKKIYFTLTLFLVIILSLVVLQDRKSATKKV